MFLSAFHAWYCLVFDFPYDCDGYHDARWAFWILLQPNDIPF
jgi:hypothetical protein